MSYDLMVFEKGTAPTGKSEFLDWYIQNMEYGTEQDISCVSEKLQAFFHFVRQVFPPMNGPFAPDDNALSEHPEMEEYLCDYYITEGMIYLSCAYSVSEYAFTVIKRAAYFAGVGFFNPSDDNSVPVLFDSRCPMLLEGEWFRSVELDQFDGIREKLHRMTVKKRSYLYVTDLIGNYIQAGGYGDAFTVEKRMYTDALSYTHTKAGYFGMKHEDKEGDVIIAGNHVKVKQNQILSRAAAEQLFLDFFQDTETVDSIEWEELDL